jgi:hypothetical protein
MMPLFSVALMKNVALPWERNKENTDVTNWQKHIIINKGELLLTLYIYIYGNRTLSFTLNEVS